MMIILILFHNHSLFLYTYPPYSFNLFSGRTGRAGKKGSAVSFVTEEDSGLFYDLKQLLVSTNNVVPHELSNHPAVKIKPGGTAPVGRISKAPLATGRD